ncbi:hypothetical protein P7C70_g416, partial [Phenoliferia sp. Uapishka_3]
MSVPAVSPVTGDPVPPHYIHASGPHFRDTSGRTILLRGINLSSSAKTPVGQPGERLDGFWEHAKDGDMSFVGRVLDLENGQADLHLERLRSWGFNCLRYVITWEAIEHQGPGQYDLEFIDYTVKLLRKCKDYGFRVYIDPHQDLWSRFAGGSGAPYWTLLACGLDPENFTETNAAFIQCEWPGGAAAFPDMIWATNYSRLACQTLFTLWAAGRDYAPKCIIDGVNIQDYLQEHYFNAMRQLGNAIADAGDLLDECVIGWDSLNEPNAGFLGVEDLAKFGKETVLRVGPMPTPFQGLRLGMGAKVQVENYKFGSLGPKRDGSVVVDPKGKRAWLDSMAEADGSPYGWTRGPDWEIGTCIWGLHGVWDPETDELLIPDYFDWYRGAGSVEAPRKVDYGQDYWLAHWKRFAPVVRSFHPEAIHFIQTPVFQIPPKIEGSEIMNRAAHSTHFYDGLTLVTKHWNWFNADALGILRGKYKSIVLGVKVGEAAIRKCMREQLGMLRQDTFDALGQFPTMMGEIGIPFDLDKKKAYTDGDYSSHTKALDASLNACDGTNALNYSIWTYCSDNSHEWGDLWNGEDLSLWSPDDARRMASFRAVPGTQLDLTGKIPSKRSRAHSKASSQSSLSSRSSTPNLSSTRVGGIITAKASVASFASTTLTVPSPASFAVDLPTTNLSSSSLLDPYLPINLNDGARAISAFCRPYPMKTVGTPIDISFEIRTSLFTLTVRVDAGDVSDPYLATEVFVPLVQYAAFPSRVCQQIRDDIRQREQPDTPPDAFLNNDKIYGVQPYSASHRSLQLPDESYEEDPATLALDVKVSAGRWETEGQILRWYYPRPVTGSVVLKLEVSRVDGAIPTWVSQAPASEILRTDLGYTTVADPTFVLPLEGKRYWKGPNGKGLPPGSTVGTGLYFGLTLGIAGALKTGFVAKEVFSDLVLPVAALNGNRAFFHLGKSSTAVKTSTPLFEQYGSSNVTGFVARDTVTFGGLTVPNQTFLAATSACGTFDEFGSPMQGILGLAFQTMARTQEPTFIDNLISMHSLSANLFGVYLGHEDDSSTNPVNSELMIGGFNRNLFSGALTILPVVNQTFWVLGTNYLTVNGRSTRGPTIQTTIDTGSEMIILPRLVAKQVWANFKGASLHGNATIGDSIGDIYQYPCAATDVISIVFQGSTQLFTINPRDLNGGPIDKTGDMCHSTLVGGDFSAGNGFGAILGIPFLKSWYSYVPLTASRELIGLTFRTFSPAEFISTTRTARPPYALGRPFELDPCRFQHIPFSSHGHSR